MNENTNAKSKGTIIAVIIIISVLVVLLLGTVGYIVYDHFKDSNPKINPANVTSGSTTTTTGTTDNTSTTTDSDTKVVGKDGYGYVSVPNNWYTFYDVDGASAIQYSYASVFILSLDVVPQSTTQKITAKDAASSYMAKELQNTSSTGVEGATVYIGKNKEYTAYQVYSYYPADNSYLVTYWFEAEDGKVHYMAIEGPESLNGIKITDFTDTIPYTFSLKK